MLSELFVETYLRRMNVLVGMRKNILEQNSFGIHQNKIRIYDFHVRAVGARRETITVDGQTNNLEKCHSRIGDPVKFSEVTRAVERVYSQVLREE